MKLHRLELQNIKSLKGKIVIDFDGTLGGAPLFLIHGPTGAGKSSLMDAVSLALFAATARLRKETVSGREELEAEDPRHVMTRGTGRCRVALTFSRMEGNRRRYFRASWSAHRARGRPDGRFQSIQREVVELTSPDPTDELEDGVRGAGLRKADYAQAFEEALVGMTRNDFHRTMLLAQGEFAAFLEADREGRSEILNRVVDTTIYRELGSRAADRWRHESRELDSWEERLEATELLDEEGRTALQAEIDEAEAEKARLEAELKPLQGALRWLEEALARLRERQSREEAFRAAKEARAERDADTERLEAHRRAERAIRVLAKRDQLRERRDEVAMGVRKLRETIKAAEEPLEEARQRYVDACAEREAAREKRENAQPILTEARRAAAERRGLEARQGEAKQTHVERLGFLKDARAARDELDNAAKERIRRLEQARKAWEAMGPWHTLAEDDEALVPIQHRVESFAQRLGTLVDRTDAREQAERDLAELETELAERREDLAPLKEALTAAEAKLDDRIRARDTLLEEGESPQNRLQALEGRLEQVRKRELTLKDAGSAAAALAELEKRRTKLRADAERHEEEVKSEREAVAAAERLHGEIKQHFATARRARDMAHLLLGNVEHHLELRAALKAGEPCPICGSLEHPVREGDGVPAEDIAKEEARAEFESATRRVEELEVRRGKVAEDLGSAKSSLAAAETALEGVRTYRTEVVADLQRHRRELAETWGTGAPASDQLVALPCVEEVDEALEELDAEWTKLSEAEREMRSRMVDVSEAQTTVDSARQELTEARRAIDKLEARQSESSRQLKSLDQQVEEAQGALGKAREQLAAAASQLPHPATVQDWDAERSREWLEEVRDLWREARKAHRTLGDTKEAAKSAHERLAHAEQAMTQAVDQEVEAREALQTLAEGVTAARSLEESFFDGRDPEDVAGGLDRSVASAETKVEEAAAKKEVLEKDQITRQAKFGEQDKARRALEGELMEASEEADRALEEVGLGEEDTRNSWLEPEEADRLFHDLQELDAALREAKVLQEDAARRWSEHLEWHPSLVQEALADPSAPEELSNLRDLVSARLSEMEPQLEEARKTHTLRTGRLADDERRRTEYHRELEALREARQKASIWKELSRLIGTREGAVFEEFAQSLILDRILAGANEHLRRLRDRYRFARPEGSVGTFEFVVRDRHHAGQERPLTTLSGGETFLASLSLALGLAGLQSQQLPIETLLLDEGFGSLDPQALEEAIGVLESLYERGYRVGVISHVEALRERIGCGIEIRPMGGGVSEVIVHGEEVLLAG